MHSLILFASGGGTNAAAIIAWFHQNNKTLANGKQVRVSLVVCNKPDAGVLEIAKQAHIPFLLIDKHTINEALLIEQLQSYEPSLIVLAGFMWKIPESVTHAFPGKIINIHPALLPAYGGKGMYGHHVHEAVVAAGEKESGITIHYVNDAYDEGDIILQAHCPVHESDRPDELAFRIHKLEHYYYPRVIEFLLGADRG
jgi:phosphoribosylglycinamide formyltransferase 1